MEAGDVLAVRNELSRILGSAVFAGSPRMSRFLKYIVEETLAGRAELIKEYSIAIEVFEKRPDYDPRTDSTVRTEASKLRAKLDRYYQTESQGQTLAISIPKGKYVPAFESCASPTDEPPIQIGRRPKWWPAAAIGAIAAAAFAWYAIDARRHPAASALRVVPLTSYPGSQLSPSFSPDGSQVAFSWNGARRDGFHIYVKLVAGGESRRLTFGPGEETEPTWSPDGNHIAFFRGSSVFVISPLGGEERKLIDARPELLSQLAWTADAKSVVIPDVAGPGEPFSLSAVAIATGERRKLTSPPREVYGDAFPVLSPDGKQLAFVRCSTSSSADIYVSPTAGGEPLRMTKDNSRIFGLTWTADSRNIVFSSNRGGSFSLWEKPVADGGTEARRLLGADGDAVFPTISRGPIARLAYTRLMSDVNIWRLDLAIRNGGYRCRGDGAPCPATPVIASTRTDEGPQFSPDGSKIVFGSDRSGRFEIWMAERDGANPVQLTALGTYSGSPRWSPDGKKVTFDSLVGSNRAIFEVSVAGGTPRRLSNTLSQDRRPAYSADGKSVYFGSDRSGSSEIWKMASEGGAATQVTHHGGYEAVESLGGEYLYYTKSKLKPGLWSMPVRGGEETLVLPGAGTGYWSVAEQGIYSIDLLHPPSAIYPSVNFPIRLFRFPSRKEEEVAVAEELVLSGSPGLSVTRHGDALLYLRAERSGSDLILMENFQ